MQNLILSPVPLSELEILIDNAVTRAIKRQQPKEPEPDGYITRAEVCKLLHITLPTVHAWMKQGKLKAYHVGGQTLFKESEVMESVQPVNYDLKKKGGRS